MDSTSDRSVRAIAATSSVRTMPRRSVVEDVQVPRHAATGMRVVLDDQCVERIRIRIDRCRSREVARRIPHPLAEIRRGRAERPNRWSSIANQSRVAHWRRSSFAMQGLEQIVRTAETALRRDAFGRSSNRGFGIRHGLPAPAMDGSAPGGPPSGTDGSARGPPAPRPAAERRRPRRCPPPSRASWRVPSQRPNTIVAVGFRWWSSVVSSS